MILPVKDLISPVIWDLATPLVRPYYDLINSDLKSQQACKKLLQTITRIALATAGFFVYKTGWHLGVRYLGLLGGMGTFCILYIIGNKIDAPANYTAATSWFLYEGILGLLRSWGASPAAMLCLLLVREKKDSQEPQGIMKLLDPFFTTAAASLAASQ